MLTQFAFFIAYGIVSLPGAVLVVRLGYVRSIVTALLAMILGCLVIPLATYADRYELILVALFIIASGITVLQVAANPLAAALGPPARSHFRLTFSQAFNSAGTVIAPYLGSALMLHGGLFAASSGAGGDLVNVRQASLHSIDMAFLLIAVLILALLLFIRRFAKRLTLAAPPPAPLHDSVLHALQAPWAVLGSAAILLYVGAEVSIGSMLARFLNQPQVLGVNIETAGKLVSLYWLGAMVGRFVGSWLLTRMRVTLLLAVAAALAALLCFLVSQELGVIAACCAICVGLCNSIMFPTIFTVTLERSTASVAATSGLMCVAIVGGAVLPQISGHIIDIVGEPAGRHAAFLLPMGAYACISLFAFSAGRVGSPARQIETGGTTH